MCGDMVTGSIIIWLEFLEDNQPVELKNQYKVRTWDDFSTVVWQQLFCASSLSAVCGNKAINI